jgi:hypothetical protein
MVYISFSQMESLAFFQVELPGFAWLRRSGVDAPRLESVMLKQGKGWNWPSGSAIQSLSRSRYA